MVVGLGKKAPWGMHRGLEKEQELASQNRGRQGRMCADDKVVETGPSLSSDP